MGKGEKKCTKAHAFAGNSPQQFRLIFFGESIKSIQAAKGWFGKKKSSLCAPEFARAE